MNAANKNGYSPLLIASQEGHVSISKILIAAGVDVNRKNNEGMNALMLASQRGHSEMALLFDPRSPQVLPLFLQI